MDLGSKFKCVDSSSTFKLHPCSIPFSTAFVYIIRINICIIQQNINTDIQVLHIYMLIGPQFTETAVNRHCAIKLNSVIMQHFAGLWWNGSVTVQKAGKFLAKYLHQMFWKAWHYKTGQMAVQDEHSWWQVTRKYGKKIVNSSIRIVNLNDSWNILFTVLYLFFG